MDPAVKKETGYIAFWVILLSVLMIALSAFGIFTALLP